MSERQMLELRHLQQKKLQQQQDSSRGAQGGDLSVILGAWLGRAPADETPSDKAPPAEPSFPAPPLSQLRQESSPSRPHTAAPLPPTVQGSRSRRAAHDPQDPSATAAAAGEAAPVTAAAARERRAQVVCGAVPGGRASSGGGEVRTLQSAGVEGGSAGLQGGSKRGSRGLVDSDCVHESSATVAEREEGIERDRLGEGAGGDEGGGAEEEEDGLIGVRIDALVPAQVARTHACMRARTHTQTQTQARTHTHTHLHTGSEWTR